MRKLDYIIYAIDKKYNGCILTEKLKKDITQDCLSMYRFFELELVFGKLNEVLIDYNEGRLNVEFILSK